MSGINTFSDFQALSKSEKIGLVQIEASRRLMGWVLNSGSVYKITGFDYAAIVAIQDSGVPLTDATSVGAISAGHFFNDRANKILYLETTDSVNPNGKFMALTFRMCFSNIPVIAPHDLASGADISWLPYLKSVGQFDLALDMQYQMGEAIEGSGDIVLHNDQAFWQPLFDKVYFENQRVFIYSWNRDLPISQAQIIYRGRVDTKRYEATQISFRIKDYLNELTSLVALKDISAFTGARVPPALQNAKQRLVYGYVFGHRPTNIDQVLTSYPMTGAASVNNGSPTVTGSGTKFLTELNKDDQLVFAGDVSQTFYTVQSVASDTSATLTENYGGINLSLSSLSQKPVSQKRWQNRKFVVAGHSLAKPTTTIAAGTSTTTIFPVASTAGLMVGDTIVIDMGGGSFQSTVISNIAGNVLMCSLALTVPPTVGASVTRPSVSAAYIDGAKLTLTRDFTYDETSGTLTLDPLAEFNIAPVKALTGSVTFTSGSNAVTGSGTTFSKLLKPGDWIRGNTYPDTTAGFFEILEVTDDSNLKLRTNSTYTFGPGQAYIRTPAVYDESNNVLSIDCIGATSDGTPSGSLLYRGPDIVKDLINRAGLGSVIESTSFSNSAVLAPQRLGFVIPSNYSDTAAPDYRTAINQVNQSIFGSLIQNKDFLLQYSIFMPSKPASRLQLRELDVIKWSIESKADNIVQTVEVDYLVKEYDSLSAASSFSKVLNTSQNAQYLAGSTKTQVSQSILVDTADAKTLAGRLGFILEFSSAVLTVSTKLRAATTSVTDAVEVNHEKIFQRIGSSSTRKIAAVQAVKKTITDIELELEDLSNAFSRCACITAASALPYSQAPDSERVTNGYYTDQYGMINNDPATFSTNLIW